MTISNKGSIIVFFVGFFFIGSIVSGSLPNVYGTVGDECEIDDHCSDFNTECSVFGCRDGFCELEIEISCDDGDLCNGQEVCDPFSGCIPISDPVECDQFECGLNECDPGSGQCIVNPDVGESCSDLDTECSVFGCRDGFCELEIVISCGDGDLCNGEEVCDPFSGCIPISDPVACSQTECGLNECDSNTGVCEVTPEDFDCDIFDECIAGLCDINGDCFGDPGPFNGELCDGGDGLCTDGECIPQLADIHVLKFHDLNFNGLPDFPEEEGIPGWTVGFECQNLEEGNALTDEDGMAWFFDILAFTECAVLEQMKDGWIATTEPVVFVDLNPGDEIVVEFGNVQVITASKSWTHTDYNWDGNTETDDVLADELPTDDDGKFLLDASVHPKNGKFQNTHPGAFYALTTVEVLADINKLTVWENYEDCTEEEELIKLLAPANKQNRAVKVAIADPDDNVTELTDSLYDIDGAIIADDESAHVELDMDIEAGSTVYVLVKFQHNLKGEEFTDGIVDEMCNNSELVQAEITDVGETSVLAEAALRITNQE